MRLTSEWLHLTLYALHCCRGPPLVAARIAQAQGTQTSESPSLQSAEGNRRTQLILTDAKGATIHLSASKGPLFYSMYGRLGGGCKTEIPCTWAFDATYKDSRSRRHWVVDEDGWKSVRPCIARRRTRHLGTHSAAQSGRPRKRQLGKAVSLTSMPCHVY